MNEQQKKALAEAYASFEDGVADRTQARLILEHIASLSVFYVAPTVGEWIKQTGSAQGYEMFLAEHEGRRRVFAEILPFLSAHPNGPGRPKNR